jgi:hypothetical protein
MSTAVCTHGAQQTLEIYIIQSVSECGSILLFHQSYVQDTCGNTACSVHTVGTTTSRYAWPCTVYFVPFKRRKREFVFLTFILPRKENQGFKITRLDLN